MTKCLTMDLAVNTCTNKEQTVYSAKIWEKFIKKWEKIWEIWERWGGTGCSYPSKATLLNSHFGMGLK